MPDPTLTILPWVRQGVASAIPAPPPSSPVQEARASIAATVHLNGELVPSITVKLFGPADVVGIDANQIIRTEPVPGTANFEPNYFALIEFDRPDFPWLFTPLGADGESKLRPWLCLVVVKKQAGVTLGSPAGAPLPVLQIGSPASPGSELPPPGDCWAWAHAQAIAADDSAAALSDAVDRQPERSLSRLVCARVLEPNTDYLACVVPTFELGRRAGLGQPIAPGDLSGAAALAPAWPATWPDGQSVRLPVYHHWEFRTGSGGDFESLVRRLRPFVDENLGQRDIDVSQPGFDASGALTTRMQGALLPLSIPPDPAPAPLPPAFTASLAAIVNAPGAGPTPAPASDATLAPPLYGGWYAGKRTVDPAGSAWVDQLNTDPRWRVAAALGTHVVQHHQESLVTSAWEQAADAGLANQRLRQLALSAEVGSVLHRKHLSALDEESMTCFAAPAFDNLYRTPGESLRAAQAASRLPLAANGFAMRRLGRLRGPLSRRVQRNGGQRVSASSWVASMNNPNPSARPPVPPREIWAFDELHPATRSDLAGVSYFGAFWVAEEGMPLLRPTDLSVRVAGRTELPGHFRAAALAHMALALPPHSSQSANAAPALAGVKATVLQQTRPTSLAAGTASAFMTLASGVQRLSSAPGASTGLEAVIVNPRFEQPMSEALAELHPGWLLPGIENVGQDAVVGLRTNGRFVDAFMVGLNHEMGRELLWRGFPSDLRATAFATFWPSASGAVLPDLHTWGQRQLGKAGAGAIDNTFVMLMRSSLLQKYPSALIYLAPALALAGAPAPVAGQRRPDLDHPILPILAGRALSDVSYFGFPVAASVVSGTNGVGGCFVVIEEQVSAPRFGVEVDTGVVPGRYLSIQAGPPSGLDLKGFTWGKNSADMAGITRQPPVQLAIHASALV
jgi:hypothetical protein